MDHLSRRQFLQGSAALAAALAALGTRDAFAADKDKKDGGGGSGGEKLRVAVVGVNGRGMSHVGGFAGKNDCVITTVCDCDEAVIGNAMKKIEDVQGKAPRYEKDLRKVVEDKDIDIVSIATPNHWHSLAAIWAVQNGKDVYVEKPVSHNVWEGRQLVEAARKYKRVVQAGTQSRSNPGMREAMQFMHGGGIGKVKVARGLCYKRRGSIGKVDGPQTPPKTCDYDLWTGPAPLLPLMRKKLHYDWHWQWAYGNGDLGNQGIHEMDKARWGLNKNELARAVISMGGRWGYVDDGETANTQICVFDYGDCQLIFEVRGLPSTSPYPEVPGEKFGGKPGENFVGNIFYGTDGILVLPNYSGGVAVNLKGEVLKKFSGGGDQYHFDNFAKAVRSRKIEELNGEILEGHLSSALCHLGNVSYRLGTEQSFDKGGKVLADNKEATETLASMAEHLKENMLPLDKTLVRVGPKLELDPKTETFTNSKEALPLLRREYRKGFEVPEKV